MFILFIFIAYSTRGIRAGIHNMYQSIMHIIRIIVYICIFDIRISIFITNLFRVSNLTSTNQSLQRYRGINMCNMRILISVYGLCCVILLDFISPIHLSFTRIIWFISSFMISLHSFLVCRFVCWILNIHYVAQNIYT